jgi:Tol biopolymer transport system component
VDATVNPRSAPIPPAVRYALVLGLVIAFALAAQVLLTGTRPHRLPTPFGPAANGRIYFDVDGGIVRANADGTDRQTIGLGGNASAPFMSPDGTTFAYVTVDPTQVAGSSVMVADADGSNAHKVSGDLPLVIDPTISPTWSPDGTQLAFGAFHEGYDEVFVANADGSGVRALGNRDSYSRSNPEWSPSGDWIAYSAWTGTSTPVIAVIRPDGTGEHALPASAGAGIGLRGSQLWAPDLTDRLVYAIGARDVADPAGYDPGDAIAIMDVNAGVQTLLSDVPGTIEHHPAWSPDGSRIAFHQGGQVAVVDPDGTHLRTLEGVLSTGPIEWSPDGNWVLGQSSHDNDVEAIDAVDDRAPVQIPLQGAEAGVFSWQRLAP